MADDGFLTEEQRRRSAEMIALARRDMAAVRDQPPMPDTSPGKFGDAVPFGPVGVGPEMDRAETADRIAGGLLGVHAGDSLGATCEFQTWAEIRQRYPDGLRDIVGGGPFGWPVGAATDDTDLTRAVLRGYLSGDGDVVRAAADGMLDWFEGRWPGRPAGARPRDVGGATATGLEHYRRTADPRGGGAGPGQAGNGSLMRCLPTALAVDDRPRRIRESMEISAVTHDDPRCTVGCAVYTEIAAVLRRGASAGTAAGAGVATAHEQGVPAVSAAVELGMQLRLPELVADGPGGLPYGGTGFVLDSLSLAVTALLDPRPLEDVLVDVVRLGGDTDTNAAIAGGLLGLRDGAGAIPARWIERLQFAAEFQAAAGTLADRMGLL
jgi:ADP-ribosylglycohydrolase